MSAHRTKIETRTTRREDFHQIIEMTRRVYVKTPPWTVAQLTSHLKMFPEGQFVAVETATQKVVGMAASLIVRWDDYEDHASWREFTDSGLFTNHDPEHGRTLYGAEVMVHPDAQRLGIGSKLYKARADFVRHLGLVRIRAAARLRGYRKYASRMDAEEYVERVVKGNIKDPTLSFQLKHGFTVIDVVGDYLLHDEESQGFAAIIEWLNPAFDPPGNLDARDRRFLAQS